MGQKTPDTTMKIPARLHSRLKHAAAKTMLSKADVLRLCLDVGLPRIEQKFAELREKEGAEGGEAKPLAMMMQPAQLGEMRVLYKSAVTDYYPEIASLDGADFVKAAEAAIAVPGQTPETAQRIRRFLAVYRQLF
jgi:protein required for attachment to host cells